MSDATQRMATAPTMAVPNWPCRLNLLFCPSLGLVEHGDVAADLQVVAVEPDGTLVGLAVLGYSGDR